MHRSIRCAEDGIAASNARSASSQSSHLHMHLLGMDFGAEAKSKGASTCFHVGLLARDKQQRAFSSLIYSFRPKSTQCGCPSQLLFFLCFKFTSFLTFLTWATSFNQSLDLQPWTKRYSARTAAMAPPAEEKIVVYHYRANGKPVVPNSLAVITNRALQVLLKESK